jgi:hypothetical protein
MGQKRVFQAYTAQLEQKCYVTSLFWLQITIFQTSECHLEPKNDYFGHKCAFWAHKRIFFGFSKLFETIRDFPGPKRATNSKRSFFSEENYQERLVLVQNYAFFRPMSTSLSQKRPFQAQKCPNTGIFT